MSIRGGLHSHEQNKPLSNEREYSVTQRMTAVSKERSIKKRNREIKKDVRETKVEARLFPCGEVGCNAQFMRKSNRKVHMRLHTNEEPYKCTYPNCGRSFRWKSSVRSHLQAHAKNQQDSEGKSTEKLDPSLKPRHNDASSDEPISKDHSVKCQGVFNYKTSAATSYFQTWKPSLHLNPEMLPKKYSPSILLNHRNLAFSPHTSHGNATRQAELHELSQIAPLILGIK
eukprot:CAMPEP_0182444110 /NCGR_PEP_ID=MMETSP1172-20130603/2666_1 /TAXON_ID=708627 /ORGANISM="Timspurckia oligopyrenoides, Strain CCMP3278" /LENGTH=227 /DNA_ID=CAMNT_0024639595 /DNA_START=257 /DNA_END=937 /DNA_ORIENTATION=-